MQLNKNIIKTIRISNQNKNIYNLDELIKMIKKEYFTINISKQYDLKENFKSYIEITISKNSFKMDINENDYNLLVNKLKNIKVEYFDYRNDLNFEKKEIDFQLTFELS